MDQGIVDEGGGSRAEGRAGRPAQRRDGGVAAPGDEAFERLLAAARANADWAWEAIYRAHAPALLGYLRAQGAASPEDLLGDVFVSLVRDLPRFSGGPQAFRAWLYRIAQNRLIDAWRMAARRPTVGVTEAPEIEDGGADPAARLQSREVVAMLRQLPPDQRAVLYLRFVADLPQREIAEVLGRRVGAVKMLQRRGEARLARLLGERRYLSDRSDA